MKNIQDFETFILEINRFKEKTYFTGNNFINKDVEDYDYTEGEIVRLKHGTWEEAYDFKVIEPGKVPTLKQIDGPREVTLKRPQDFSIISPEKLRPSKIKEPKPEWMKPMTQVEFKRLCRETISGHEYDDHGIFYDLGSDQVKINNRLQEYLRKLIMKDYTFHYPHGNGIIKMQDLIEKFVNELEMYAK